MSNDKMDYEDNQSRESEAKSDKCKGMRRGCHFTGVVKKCISDWVTFEKRPEGGKEVS